MRARPWGQDDVGNRKYSKFRPPILPSHVTLPHWGKETLTQHDSGVGHEELQNKLIPCLIFFSFKAAIQVRGQKNLESSPT